MKTKEYYVGLNLPKELKKLEDIVYNLWWTYSWEAQDLFRMIDPEKWEKSEHNPVEMISMSLEKLNQIKDDHIFLSRLDNVWNDFQEYLKRSRWFDSYYKDEKYNGLLVAYFSAEYGFHESLHLYSGGLGILSGDHCKAASDLGVPFVAVGLLYRNGYFRQYLNTDGWQQEYYPFSEFYKMPVKEAKDKNGSNLIVTVESPNGDIYVKVWQANVGVIKLFLLDTNIDQNRQEDKDITGQLYGGDINMRIRQEIILGVGGLRALKALNLNPTVFHINEGHPVFALLERLRLYISENKLNTKVACEIIKKSTLFTTHTPVAAGFDVFGYDLMNYYLSPIIKESGLSISDIMKLGRIQELNQNEPFSMAVCAIKLGNYRNGVSKLHGQVSRDMFKNLWAKAVNKYIPIGHITNGVHIATWVSDEIKTLFNRYLGERWFLQPYDPFVWNYVDNIPDIELYNAFQRLRSRLLAFTRMRLWKQAKNKGASSSELLRLREVLNPNSLTIGFARRFASYKRAYLLFMDEARLNKILNNPAMPVQMVIAGKAHPKDDTGKNILKRIIHTIRKPEFRNKIVFIEDYDIEIARHLVQGVDLWINTPRRPMEACGTSGMKAALNGALNFSILDGWWNEAYNNNNGWTIGSGETYEDEAYQDFIESQEIYDKLENEIIPLFYLRDKEGVPREWLKIAKNSIKSISSYFSTARMLIDYVKKYYINLHETYVDIIKDNYNNATVFTNWLENISNKWNSLKFIKTYVDSSTFKLGDNVEYSAYLNTNGINAESITVYVMVEYNPTDSFENAKFLELNLEKVENNTATFKLKSKLENSGRLNVAFVAFPKHSYTPNLFEYNILTWSE